MTLALPPGLRLRKDRSGAIVRDFMHRGKRVRVMVGTVDDVQTAIARAPEIERAERARIDGLFGVSFADLADRWLNGRVKARRTKGGVDLATQRVRDHILPGIGPRARGLARDIDQEDLFRLRNHLATKGLAPQTVHHVLSEVRGILRFGERVKDASGQWVIRPGENPWGPDILPKIERRAPKGLTDDQVDQLVGACSNADQEFQVRLLLLTGLRWGEVRRLEWPHFQDDDHPRLMVEVTKTKTFRVLPLVPEAVELLRARQRATRAIGGRISPTKAKNGGSLFMKLSARAGFHAHAHQLRHTWGHRMLRAGLILMAVQGGFGHSTVKTTEGYLPEAYEVLALALRGAPAEMLRSCSKYGRPSPKEGAGA